jgi:glycosyltransferase involved in cell wall biosynthesis
MYGGVETFLTTLAREASSVPEMSSEFAVCFEGRFSRELTALGRTPHLLNPVRLSRPHTLLRARQGLKSVLNRAVFDVVVCHQPWPYVAFGSVARRAGLPVVLWVHMATEGKHWLERLARRTKPDLAICNSRFSAARAAEWLSGAPIELVYCPVSLPDHAALLTQRNLIRRTHGTAVDDVVIVHASRLDPIKGHRVLLAALARLREMIGWTCWIVGGPTRDSEADYLRALQAFALEQGITDRVRFLGERTDVAAIFRAANVFCQPNTSPEAFGLSLVEALHAGLPVVTTGIGGACEIVDSSCGMLLPPADPQALSGALRTLIVDRDLRARLGAAARRRPGALCDAPRQMRRIHDVLSSVAAA